MKFHFVKAILLFAAAILLQAHVLAQPKYRGKFYTIYSDADLDTIRKIESFVSTLKGNSWYLGASYTQNKFGNFSFDIARVHGIEYVCGGPCLPVYTAYGVGYETAAGTQNASVKFFVQRFLVLFLGARLDIIKGVSGDFHNRWWVRPSLGIDGYYFDVSVNYTLAASRFYYWDQGVGITLRAKLLYPMKNWPRVKVG